jgi:hypothetical protein
MMRPIDPKIGDPTLGVQCDNHPTYMPQNGLKSNTFKKATMWNIVIAQSSKPELDFHSENHMIVL